MKIFDTIVCDDSRKISEMLTPNSIDLSIVVPPYVRLTDYYSKIHKSSRKTHKSKKEESITDKYLNFMDDFLKGVAKVTKLGGICCLILSNEIDPKTDAIIPISQATIVKLMTPTNKTADWQIDGQIIWVKSPREKTESINDEADTHITFSETPYSVIYILMKKGKNVKSISMLDRIWKLRLSEEMKIEMSDFVWYIQPSSEKGYKDHIPKDLANRLVMLFSLENELVLDPFARNGVTAVVSKTLKRHFLCIEKNSSKVEKAKKRLKSIE